MGLFWKRKSGDQFVSLKLNEPLPAKTTVATEETAEANGTEADSRKPVGKTEASRVGSAAQVTITPSLEAVPTGAGPTPVPSETSSRAVERRAEIQTSKVPSGRTEVPL